MSTCSHPLRTQTLINQHGLIVERILENINIEQYPHSNKETLRELGYVSLMEASLNPKPSNQSFERYATMLIQGRMIQHLFAI